MNERIQLLDDLGAEFARIATEADHTSRTPPATLLRQIPRARALAISLCIAALLGGTAYAVPATRAAIDDLAGWVAGDEAAPGRALGSSHRAPRWFDGAEDQDVRLIARADGVALYVRRAESDSGTVLEFGVGHGIVMGDTLESWRRRLDGHAVVILGSTFVGPRDALDPQGRAPLAGITVREVDRVRLQYREGPPLVSETGDGGFVLLIDAWRPLQEIVAYDRTGRVVERLDISDYDLRYLCIKDPACPPKSSRTR